MSLVALGLLALNLAPIKHYGADEVHGLCFTGKAQIATIASGGRPNLVLEMVDVASGTKAPNETPEARATMAIACSPDGALVATGHATKVVRLWDAKSGALVRTLSGHTEGVLSVAFSPDGKRVVSAGFDGTVRIWDAQTGAAGPVLIPLKAGSAVTRAIFSPDGTRVAAASGTKMGQITLLDAASGEKVIALSGNTRATWNIAFVADGKRLLSVTGDGAVKLWDLQTGAVIRSYVGHEDTLRALAVSPDGTLAATAGGSPGAGPGPHDYAVRLWNIETGAQLLSWNTFISQVSSLAFSPDGTRLAVGAQLDGLWLMGLEGAGAPAAAQKPAVK